MTHRPLVIGRVVTTQIHQAYCVLGIFNRPVVMLQSQPRNPPVIELHKFPISFKTLIVIHDEIRILLLQLQNPIQKSRIALDLLSVRSPLRLHLQNAQINPHLNHVTPVGSLDQPNRKRMRIKFPLSKQLIEPLG